MELKEVDKEQNWPDESDSSGADGAASSSSRPSSAASATTSSAPASTTSAAAAATTHHSGLSAGAIAGIAIGTYETAYPWIDTHTHAISGGAAVLLMAATLIYLCGRNRALSDIIRPRRNHLNSGNFEGGGVQYVQAVPKHVSGMTMASPRPESDTYMRHSPALPGYVGPSDSVQSPPRIHYAPSDALSLATPAVRSPSTGSVVVPAYAQLPPLQSQTP